MARTTFTWEIEYINVGLTNDSLSPLLSSRVEISFTYKNVFQNVSVYLKLWMHFIQQNDAISKR